MSRIFKTNIHTMENMKNRVTILLPFLLCLSPLWGQLRGERHLPRAGDRLVKQRVTHQPAGKAGENTVWDFSAAVAVVDPDPDSGLDPDFDPDYPVSYFTRGEGTGLTCAEPGFLLHHRVSGDSLLVTGYESPGVRIMYGNPGLLLRFPVSLGDFLRDEFSGRGIHHDRLESVVAGSLETTADGTGCILLPGKERVENVVRIHTRRTETTRYAPVSRGFDITAPVKEVERSYPARFSPPTTVVTDTYLWYAAGCRYPVFETVESRRLYGGKPVVLRESSFLYPPRDQVFDTGGEQPPPGSPDHPGSETPGPWADLVCVLAPNPAGTTVDLILHLPLKAEVRVRVHDTRGAVHMDKNLGSRPAGDHRIQLDVSALPVGNHVLEVRLNEHTESLVLMIRR